MPRDSEAKSKPNRSAKREFAGRITGRIPETDAPKTAAQIANRSSRKRFKFEVDAFDAWLRTKGFNLNNRERGFWKTHGWTISTPQDRPADRSIGRRTPSGETAQREAREALFRAFKLDATGGSVRIMGTGLAVSKAARTLGLQRYRKAPPSDGGQGKVEIRPPKTVSLKKSPASEGLIKQAKATPPTTLPETPPAVWPGRPRGRPRPSTHDPMLEFLAATYGPYYAKCRNELRAYIHRNDIQLYRAIRDFERTRELPEELSMPNAQELVQQRIQKAASGAYNDMSPVEKLSVLRATKRKIKGPSL